MYVPHELAGRLSVLFFVLTALQHDLLCSVLLRQSKGYADAEDAEFQLGADLEERGGTVVSARACAMQQHGVLSQI